MQRKTVTTLSELQKGDRFVYNKKPGTWQVMEKDGSHIEVNEIVNEMPLFKFNEKKQGKTVVQFLRHTIPVPGQDCFICDLGPGDVFYKTGDLMTEYELVGPLKTVLGMYGLRMVASKEDVSPLMTHALTSVVLVRRAENKGGA